MKDRTAPTSWRAEAATLYIGVTGNLHQRVFEHKWKERDGFTARYNCDRLIWFESSGGAMQFESSFLDGNTLGKQA